MTDLSTLSDDQLKAMYSSAPKPLSAMSDEELKAAYEGPSIGKDIVKSGGAGLEKGVTNLAGMPGDLSNLLALGSKKAGDYIGEKLGFGASPEVGAPVLPTSGGISKAVESKIGERYKPQTTYGKYAETVGEFLPASLLGPGGTLAKLGTGAVAGLGSEVAGQISEGTAAEPYARIAGALAGGLAPTAVGRAITPLPSTAARQRLVDILHDEGVTSLTAGQRTGSKPLQYAEDMLGNAPGAGQSATNIRQRGQEQFTEAAMRRAGPGLENATPEVLAQNQQRLTNEFRDLSSRNTLNPDPQLMADLTEARRVYDRVPQSQQRAIVDNYLHDIATHVQNTGTIPGPAYQAMRSRLSTQSYRLRDADPDLSNALGGVRNALDDAMERSIPAASPDAALWRQARQEYGAQEVIKKTASRAGEATAEGQLVPANLRNTVAAENRSNYALGRGPFSELARAGSGVMAPLPNSGTAQRLNLTNIAMLPVTATIGRALMSRPVQGYLGNQALAGRLGNLPGTREAIARALLAQGQPQLLGGPRP